MAKPRRKRGTAGDKTICLPVADGRDYGTLVEDREAFRQYLNEQIAAHPVKDMSRFFQQAFDFPDAYRTSNQVDRPMNYLDCTLYAMQNFHGLWESAEQSSRAMALLWNSHPFCRKTRKATGCLCPFEQLNGFRYHDTWVRNLLIATSLNARRPLLRVAHTK